MKFDIEYTKPENYRIGIPVRVKAAGKRYQGRVRGTRGRSWWTWCQYQFDFLVAAQPDVERYIRVAFVPFTRVNEALNITTAAAGELFVQVLRSTRTVKFDMHFDSGTTFFYPCPPCLPGNLLRVVFDAEANFQTVQFDGEVADILRHAGTRDQTAADLVHEVRDKPLRLRRLSSSRTLQPQNLN